MQWLRFRYQEQIGWGVLEGGQVRPHAGVLFEPFQEGGEPLAVADLQLLAPCEPGKIIGLWNNFRAAAEKSGWAQPAEPLYFLKSPSSACGHQQAIPVPASYDGRVVFEGELVIVIGSHTKAVTPDAASGHIFGYTCGNDLTAVDLLHRDPSFGQWTRSKSFDGFAAFGPLIDTEFDPARGHLRTLVGGRERQNYAFSDMFFSPAEIVSRISQDMSLEAGDLIYCGTSLGVLPMKAGTTVEVVVEGIGTLRNQYG
jgi:2-keto-4-pentenoate hydratase/2-oxohepta-3-ene-1,7-dioic acid hydratase in catechol pathway